MSTWTKKTLQNQLNRARNKAWYPALVNAATSRGLPLAFLLAIVSRESDLTNKNGDGGHGRSLMQIDDRSHKVFIAQHPDIERDVVAYIDYGVNLLVNNRAYFQRTYKGLTDQQYLKLAAAAYNSGISNTEKAMKTGDCDARTTGKDYGKDVLALMIVFQQILDALKS